MPSLTSKSTLVASLLLVAGASADKLHCLRTDNTEIIQQTACGDKGSIAYCLGNLQPTDTLTQDIATCFVNAGCTEAEADIEAIWTLSQCEPSAKDRADLRKRQANKSETEDADAAPTAAKPATTAKAGPKTTLTPATAEPEEKTTDKAQTTEKPATPTTPTPEPTTTAPPTTATTSPATTTPAAAANGHGLAHSGRPLQCYTTSLSSTSSCPLQSTGSNSGKPLPCFPTTTPVSVCAEGLICQSDGRGGSGGSCMFRYQRWDAAGVIIAIFFGVAVTAAIAMVVGMCWRDKRKQKRWEAQEIAREARAMADKGGVGLSVAEVRDPGEERRGLMGGNGNAGGYEGAGAGPFGDQHRVR
ncbi:hypothetical protein GE09DRAFT_338852 [Coniochaeta sp. 2T2.1]|nr:hypothetical protein GE09DRAFT_338852 [Coniochaeta sp. 2T2.1]